MSRLEQVRLGISQSFPCSYIEGEKETLLLCCQPVSNLEFEQLLALGFRRSGDQIYRPHCASCQACIPVRIPVKDYQPTRSQRRVFNKNRDITWIVSEEAKPVYNGLYHRYINARHHDGSMYPPSDKQFKQFLLTSNHPTLFIEGWLNEQLIAVAVTDILENSLSSTYTFFDPELPQRSLGKRAIMAQIEIAQQMRRQYLYLGYQISHCQKMAYKTEFQPVEVFRQGNWAKLTG